MAFPSPIFILVFLFYKKVCKNFLEILLSNCPSDTIFSTLRAITARLLLGIPLMVGDTAGMQIIVI